MSLTSGFNHVALVAGDLDTTADFYANIFDLAVSEITAPGDERNAILFFPNGSFLHIIEGDGTPIAGREKRPDGGLHAFVRRWPGVCRGS